MGSGSSGLKGRGGGSVATAYSDIMDGKATLDSLSALRPQMDIRQATFTTNGNSIKLQVASVESNGQRIDLVFRSDYDPMQTTKPTRAIRNEITATLWNNGNAAAIRTIKGSSTKSLRNAAAQYSTMLDNWKKLTGQSSISF